MGSNMQLILTKEEMSRVVDKIAEDGTEMIRVDLHQLSVKNAHRLINNIIATNRDEFRMKLIHGYNHGIAIKQMINTSLTNPRIESRTSPSYNPGETTMKIAAA